MKNKKTKHIKLLLLFNIGIILIVAVVGINVHNSFNSYKYNIKELEIENNELKNDIGNLLEANEQMRKYKTIYDNFSLINTHTDTRYYEDVPLTFNEQEFIQKVAEENGFSETLVYGLMKAESNFRKNAVSYNDTSYGIMQINHNYSDFYAQLAGLEEYDIMDFHDNVKMGIAVLKYAREYWISEGINSQEDLTHYMLSSYNKGQAGLYNHIRKNGTAISGYSSKVLKYKYEMEQNNN